MVARYSGNFPRQQQVSDITNSEIILYERLGELFNNTLTKIYRETERRSPPPKLSNDFQTIFSSSGIDQLASMTRPFYSRTSRVLLLVILCYIQQKRIGIFSKNFRQYHEGGGHVSQRKVSFLFCILLGDFQRILSSEYTGCHVTGGTSEDRKSVV